MSLENLLKIGQLKTHPPDRDEIQKLLGAAPGGRADCGQQRGDAFRRQLQGQAARQP
ncbi:MAG: hypothetical protein ACREWG_11440 [Gammaproteobacteria bacterium]